MLPAVPKAMVEVKVVHIILDRKNTPVVILKESDGERMLPIWIAPPEAGAIAMGLAGEKFERPLTHDLLRQVIVGLEAKLECVVITEVKHSTYFAQLHLRRNDHVIQIDARPSDSIALALRLDAPIFSDESILDATGFDASDIQETERLDSESLRSYLEDLDPEDFGKFNL